MKNLQQQLLSGAVMRYRPGFGFYIVLSGKSHPVAESTGRKAVQSELVRPNGKDSFGVYLFTLNAKAVNAMPAVPSHPQTLPTRPAAVPNALPDVPSVRRKADSKTPAPIPADSRAAQGQVQAGAGGLDGSGAQRTAVAGAGKGDCVGCGAEGVTA